jgi:hypothetical protein
MISPVQSSPTPMNHALADDSCTRIQLYQQQLRAELLSAVADEAARSASWRRWLDLPAIQPRIAIAAVRGIERRLRLLFDAGVSHTHRQTAALGLAHADA